MGIILLKILKAYLSGEDIDIELNHEEWMEILRLAQGHSILPMIYQEIYNNPSFNELDPHIVRQIKNEVFQDVMKQTMKTSQFLKLYKELTINGIRPLVVKGIICRSIYPEPDQRISNDEDMLIGDAFDQCHQFFMDHGLFVLDHNIDIHDTYEVPYSRKGTMLYIELHKTFFSNKEKAYGYWNKFFENVQDRAIKENIDGVNIYTLDYTTHFLYLILHAFKHFLHSGVGIRQVCDIVMYANTYGNQIHWHDVYNKLESIHAEVFACAILDIGKRYLVFDEERSCISDEWKKNTVDSEHLLGDILEAGVYGDSSMSRKHSSNMTLEAVSNAQEGKKSRASLRMSLFPSKEALKGRYPYLEKHGYLLPVAWIHRIFKYRKETKGSQNNDAIEALKIGQERVELMKEYKVIK